MQNTYCMHQNACMILSQLQSSPQSGSLVTDSGHVDGLQKSWNQSLERVPMLNFKHRLLCAVWLQL